MRGRLFKNACTDLNEMLRGDRCRDMDELINCPIRIIVLIQEPDYNGFLNFSGIFEEVTDEFR